MVNQWLVGQRLEGTRVIKFWTPFASNWFIFFIVIFLHVIWQKVNVHVVCDVNFVVCDDVSECDEFDF